MRDARTEKEAGALRHRRLMLKISGEALKGRRASGFSLRVLEEIARQVEIVGNLGAEICLVIGGGNFFRGRQGAELGVERTTGDYMGMLATVMNALAMQSTLERRGLDTRVLSAVPMNQICEPYILRRALRHLEKGRICIFAAGTGNPCFSTDTAAVLRAVETGCTAIFKGTAVDGVYDRDPVMHPDARRYERIDFSAVLQMDLKVLDASAVALARDNDIPLIVFSLNRPGALAEVVQGRGDFTTIGSV